VIIALEGPDKSGKTTVFHCLQAMRLRAKFVPSVPIHPDLMPVMHHVERRQADLWSLLYDKSKMYVADRHFAVSAPIYDAIFNRPVLNVSSWIKELFVVYFDVPIPILEQRYRSVGDALFDAKHYAIAKRLYETAIRQFRYVKLDGTRKPELLADEVACLIESLR
jgi:thymidylate kinase